MGTFRSYSRSENPWSFWTGVLITLGVGIAFLFGLFHGASESSVEQSLEISVNGGCLRVVGAGGQGVPATPIGRSWAAPQLHRAVENPE
jgi:hypothetical protein